MKQFWLAFAQVKGLGAVRLRHIYEHYQDLSLAWDAPRADLLALGLPPEAVDHQQHLKKTLDPDRLLNDVYKRHAWVLTFDDTAYPPLLKAITDPPMVLYGSGTLTPHDQRAIAVVGTRKATGYGKQMTETLVNALVAHGVTIVSGLAHGIDIEAHRAALAAGGRTIAVLGTGIDSIYPQRHRETAVEIVANGAVLTEFPLGTKPLGKNFPARNRIISGLCLGVLVVEAPEKSGALQTAEFAAEEGREVFAVPGNADSLTSRGTNLLIQDGASLTLTAQDILNTLDIAYRNVAAQQTVEQVAPDNDQEKHILQHLMNTPLHVDDLSRLCHIPIQELTTTLMLMQIKELVYETAPMTYHATEMVKL